MNTSVAAKKTKKGRERGWKKTKRKERKKDEKEGCFFFRENYPHLYRVQPVSSLVVLIVVSIKNPK